MTDALDDGDLHARSAAVRAEWRDDEEAWTRAAFEHWEHRRTLVDIVRDCMIRADEVILTTPHVRAARCDHRGRTRRAAHRRRRAKAPRPTCS